MQHGNLERLQIISDILHLRRARSISIRMSALRETDRFTTLVTEALKSQFEDIPTDDQSRDVAGEIKSFFLNSYFARTALSETSLVRPLI